jgi:hypothetical protein
MAAINLFPLNDLSIVVNLAKVNPVTAAIEPLTGGTVDHFISTSTDPATAAPADGTLVGSAVYTGVVDPTTQAGRWLVQYDAAVLTPALLATQFATLAPYLILKQAGGFWAYIPLKYVATRKGTVV